MIEDPVIILTIVLQIGGEKLELFTTGHLGINLEQIHILEK